MDTALDGDISRVPAIIVPVLPLAGAGWTLTTVLTPDTITISPEIAGTPAALPSSVQISVTTVPVVELSMNAYKVSQCPEKAPI